MVRLNAPIFIVLDKNSGEFDKRDPPGFGARLAFFGVIAITVVVAVGAAMGWLTARAPEPPAPPGPPWACWSTEANYCKH